jgi:multisubunit Na+/H+ antiporter MnhG subunit
MILSNILGIIGGIVVVIIGIILIICWWPMFIAVLQGVIPILLILIGAGALVYFISEIKSKMEMKKEEPSISSEKKPEEK